MHRQELILHRAREGQGCPVGRIGQLQIEFALVQGTQQLRSGRAVIGAGVGHERTDDRRIQCRSVELVAGFQDAEEPTQTTLPVDLDKSIARTGLAGRVKINLSHIRGRLRDRAIAQMTPPPAKLGQEECGDALEIFGSERPNRAVRFQHRRRGHLSRTGICGKMHREERPWVAFLKYISTKGRNNISRSV